MLLIMIIITFVRNNRDLVKIEKNSVCSEQIFGNLIVDV